MVNQALELDGRPPMFTEEAFQTSSKKGTTFRSDEFFNKPLAAAVRMILQRRQTTNLGAAPQEGFMTLNRSGFDFESRARISRSAIWLFHSVKNMLFQRTPNGNWGLREWYGGSRNRKRLRAKI